MPEQFSTLFKINDDDPEAQVPTAKDRSGNPLGFGYYVQDLLTRAEVEGKRKNQAGVIKYLRALAAALPEEARSWALLCEAYQTRKTGIGRFARASTRSSGGARSSRTISAT